MKKNELIITIAFSLTILAAMLISGSIPALGIAGNVTYFNVTATINGGSPTITYVDAISGSPAEGTTKVINFYFNATHPNGVSNIPATGAHVKINQSGTTLSESGCRILATDGATLNRFECNISINYYNLPGTWTINATIIDISSNVATNTSAAYTNGQVYGVTLKTNSMTFAGNPGTNNVASGTNPQQVNNTGNVAYSQINLTAYSLQSGANFIGAGNFTANVTGQTGQALANNAPVTLTGSGVGVQGSKDVYLYLNIPLGTPNGTYTSTSQWVVTMS